MSAGVDCGSWSGRTRPVRGLGPAQLGAARVPVAGEKATGTLALLCIAQGRSVSADAIADMLWADDPPSTADTVLRVHISRLRKLGERAGLPSLITRSATGYRLGVESADIDAVRFETATCSGCFTVNPRPTIGTLSLNSRPRGTIDSTALVSGTGFQAGAIFTVSGTGVDATVVAVTPTQLTLLVTVAPGAVTGLRSVSVRNPDAGTVTKANAFRVT